MKVLVVGSGGREHAIAWHLARHGHRVFAAPGNAGIAGIAACFPVAADDAHGLARLVEDDRIDLTVVGPEAPLVAGIADEFHKRGLHIFGPDAAGARIEGDKAFAKQLMRELAIPTARFGVFHDVDAAMLNLADRRFPVVVKASGLAAGKGVSICRTEADAYKVLKGMLSGELFGAAGKTVVIEDFLEGEEVSMIALCDGRDYRLLPPAQDHKRLRDKDQGPNTGGMGAYAPAPVATLALQQKVAGRVFDPLIAGLRARGIKYVGALYAGMIITRDGLFVLEFNCRFGDPETQAVLPLVEDDLAEVAMACIDGTLGSSEPIPARRHAVCVVAAAPGYPDKPEKGLAIEGDAFSDGDTIVFHAGTAREGERLVTTGGRVLGVTGVGDSFDEARKRAYAGIERVRFPGMQYRRDIGWRATARR
jgi:phosphoribosylamine--glycine ligase